MNPETTLTPQDIQAICAHHSISYQSDKRITTGFSNEVHLINGKIILKVLSRPENIERFTVEKKMLAYDGDFLKPKFIAADFSKELISSEYILMQYVEGDVLGFIWHTLDDETRESLIKQISETLQGINEINPGYLFDTHKKWGDGIANGFAISGQQLVDRQIISKAQFKEIKAILERHCSILNSTDTKVVYDDIHFDNFIVRGDKLVAIIDLESVSEAALDYPIYVVRKMMAQPHKYLTEENEQYAKLEDYENLEVWYRKYYPAMFQFDHFEERVAIYQILDVLHLLKDWHMEAPELYEQLEEFIAKLR